MNGKRPCLLYYYEKWLNALLSNLCILLNIIDNLAKFDIILSFIS